MTRSMTKMMKFAACVAAAFGLATTAWAATKPDDEYRGYVSLNVATASKGLGKISLQTSWQTDDAMQRDYYWKDSEKSVSGYDHWEAGQYVDGTGKRPIEFFVYARPMDADAVFEGFFLDDACSHPMSENAAIIVDCIGTNGALGPQSGNLATCRTKLLTATTYKPEEATVYAINVPTIDVYLVDTGALEPIKIYAKFSKPVTTTYVAQIGETKYETLQAALNVVAEGQTIQLLPGTIEEGEITLPTTIKNVTIAGAADHASILKNTTLAHRTGDKSFDGLTIDGVVFDNGRFILVDWGAGSIKNLTFTSNIFRNLNDATNEAAIHLNLNAAGAVSGFTFENNVIDGCTGGSKSGIYGAVKGNTTIRNNTFNNVAFRPICVQIIDTDGVADNTVVTGNTFSGSSVGRLQIYGTENDTTCVPEGTDGGSFIVNNNIFKDITSSQQICCWGINTENVTTDITGNYYDVEDPRMFWNDFNGASSFYLSDTAIAASLPHANNDNFNYYTELEEDGTIKESSKREIIAKTYVAQIGEAKYMSINDAFEAVNSQAGDDVTIKILCDIKEKLGADYELFKNVNLVTDVEGGVTVDFDHVSTDGDSSIETVGKTLTIAEGVNIVRIYQLFNGYYANRTDTTDIYGDAELCQLWAAHDSIVNIYPTAHVVMGCCDGMVKLRWSGTLNVTGSANDSQNKQLSGGYIWTDYPGVKTVNLKDTYVSTAWLTVDDEPGTQGGGSLNLSLDNATLETAHESSNGVSYGAAGGTISMKNGSLIIADKIQNVTTITIDGASYGTEAVKVIDYTGSGTMTLADYATTITVTGGMKAEVRDNDLWIVPIVYVAQIGETKYETLAAAVVAAKSGDTVTLLADIETLVGTKIEKTLTIDLNGHTLYRTGTADEKGAEHYYGTAIYSSTANITLTVVDSSEGKTGVVKSYHYGIMMDGGSLVVDGIKIQSGDKHGIYMDSGNADGSLTAKNCTITGEAADAIGVYNGKNHVIQNCEISTTGAKYSTITKEGTGTLTLEDTSITCANTGIAVNKGKLVFESGEITAGGEAAISTHGVYGGSVEIKGGTISGMGDKSFGVYFPSKSNDGDELVISGGTISGKTGVVVKGGLVDISGSATIIGNGKVPTDIESQGSAGANTGDALYIEANYGLTENKYYHNIRVTIEGGTFTSEHGHAVAARFKATTTHTLPTINIAGGTFTSASGKDVLTTGNDFDGTLKATGGVYSALPVAAYVAEGYEAAARGTTPETWVVREESYEFDVPVEDEGEEVIPVAIPKEVFENPVDKDGNTVDVSTPEKKLEYVNSEAANGMKVWQNVAMGVDGTQATNVIEPVEGVATSAEKTDKVEPVVITTPIVAFNAPDSSATKVAVKYNLLKGMMDAEGRIVWAAQPVAVLDTPRFVVDVKDDTGDTYWKIEAVFKSVK